MIDILRSINFYKMETQKTNAMPCDIEGQNAEQNGDWIKSIHKERITSTMTKYFHDVNKILEIDVPVVNIGTFGRDGHMLTERVDMKQTFENVPNITVETIRTLLK